MSVEEPPVVIDGGLKPPLVIPVGKPFMLPTLKFTVPVKPLSGVTVTVYVVDPPGTTSCAAGPTVMSKSGLVGSTVYCPRRWVWIRVARSVDHRERDCVHPVCTECDVAWILRC